MRATASPSRWSRGRRRASVTARDPIAGEAALTRPSRALDAWARLTRRPPRREASRMTHPALAFYFDYLSPYAYLAWTQLPALAARVGRAVRPVPVLFAGLLNHWGQKGPAEIPPKRAYVFKDCARLAHRLGVAPLVPPPHHPFNPLLALRVSSLPMSSEARVKVIDGLYRAVWEDGVGVEDVAVVACCASAAGLDGEGSVREAQGAEVKARLREQTEEAIGLGVFGIPTVVVDGELFWGLDSLGHMERFLRGEDVIDPKMLARWGREVVPSAVRR